MEILRPEQHLVLIYSRKSNALRNNIIKNGPIIDVRDDL